MPYAYSASAQREAGSTGVPAPPPRGGAGRRNRMLALVVGFVCLVGTVLGIVAAVLPGSATDTSPAGALVRRALVVANVVEQNLAAPAPGPPHASAERAFVLSSHGVDGAGVIGGDSPSPVRPLDPATARAVLAGQGSALRSVFSGALLRREQALLSSLVADERARSALRATPGGAAVVQWLGVHVAGNAARAEALVARWEQQDRLTTVNGTLRLARRVVREEVDALATLRRSGGVWRLVSLAEAPWQEPT